VNWKAPTGRVLGLVSTGLLLIVQVQIVDGQSDSVSDAEVPIAGAELFSVGASGNDCGFYCVLAACHALGKPTDSRSLFGQHVNSTNAGSTANDIVRVFHEVGVSAYASSMLSLDAIMQTGCPVLLHLRSMDGKQGNHWVLFLGFEDDKAIVFDAPGIFRIDLADLKPFWSGNCVVADADTSKRITFLSYGLFQRISQLLFPMVIVAMLSWFEHYRNSPLRHLEVRKSAISAILIIVACGAGAYLHARMSEISLSSHVRDCLSMHSSQDIRYIADIETVQLSPGQLIDCRFPRQFREGHLAGARNFPVNSGIIAWLEFCAHAPDDAPLIVYCQNSNCGWADETCRRMCCMGLDARVLSGGMSGNMEQVASIVLRAEDD